MMIKREVAREIIIKFLTVTDMLELTSPPSFPVRQLLNFFINVKIVESRRYE